MTNSPTADPIQAQLIAARRSQILDAATKVFAAKGFHRATIKDVAQEAGIADGTIYNYFENKNALLLSILDRLNETPQRGEHFAQSLNMDLSEWANRYIRYRPGTLESDGMQILQVLLPEILVNHELREAYYQQIIAPTYALAEPFFTQWVESGKVRDVDPKLALRVVSGMFLGVSLLRLIGDKELEQRWAEVPDILAEIILHGLNQGNTDE